MYFYNNLCTHYFIFDYVNNFIITFEKQQQADQALYWSQCVRLDISLLKCVFGNLSIT